MDHDLHRLCGPMRLPHQEPGRQALQHRGRTPSRSLTPSGSSRPVAEPSRVLRIGTGVADAIKPRDHRRRRHSPRSDRLDDNRSPSRTNARRQRAGVEPGALVDVDEIEPYWRSAGSAPRRGRAGPPRPLPAQDLGPPWAWMRMAWGMEGDGGMGDGDSQKGRWQLGAVDVSTL